MLALTVDGQHEQGHGHAVIVNVQLAMSIVSRPLTILLLLLIVRKSCTVLKKLVVMQCHAWSLNLKAVYRRCKVAVGDVKELGYNAL